MGVLRVNKYTFGPEREGEPSLRHFAGGRTGNRTGQAIRSAHRSFIVLAYGGGNRAGVAEVLEPTGCVLYHGRTISGRLSVWVED